MNGPIRIWKRKISAKVLAILTVGTHLFLNVVLKISFLFFFGQETLVLSPSCRCKESQGDSATAESTLEIVKSGLDQLELVLAESERKEEQRAESERKLLAEIDALPQPPSRKESADITPTELESPMVSPIAVPASMETPENAANCRGGSKIFPRTRQNRIKVSPSKRLAAKATEVKSTVKGTKRKTEAVKTNGGGTKAKGSAKAKAAAKKSGTKATGAAKAKAAAKKSGTKAERAAEAKAAAKKSVTKAEGAAKAKARGSKAKGAAAKARATRTKQELKGNSKKAKESKPETYEGEDSKIDENAVKRKLHSVTWEHVYFLKITWQLPTEDSKSLMG